MDFEEQIKSLRQELEQKSKDLELAAEIGKTLLEQNKDLEEELEKISQTHCNSIEDLEQEKYSLQLKLKSRDKLDALHASELENLRDQLVKENVEKEELLRTCHERDMGKIQEKTKVLQSDLERAATIEGQLKEKIEELQKLLNESHELLHSQQGLSTTATEQTTELHLLIADMEEEKAFLRIELKDKKDELSQLVASKDGLQQQMAKLNDEVLDELKQKEKESISYYNALEKCREEVVDLQLQLDNVKLESLDTDQTGNSLFGEVEDKRKEIERKYISMKVQYDGIKNQLAMKKQQINKMKFQIATLLQMSASRADSSHMEHLRQQLSQSQFEVKALMDKLSTLEQKQVSAGIGDDLQQLYHEEVSAGGAGKKTYTDYLKQLIATNNDKLSEAKEELQTQRMLLMSKSDCLMTCERKLYASQVLVDQERAKNIKLVLKFDELKRKMALEPEITKQAECTTFVEKLPIKPEETDMQTSEQDKNLDTTEDRGQGRETRFADITEKCPLSAQPLTSNLEEKNQKIVNEYNVSKKTKKSVSVAEMVDVLSETGEVDQVELRSDDSCQKLPKEKASEKVGKRGGKKHHKVVYVNKENTNECTQQ